MNARRLIVNADGFGFTAGNNRAIFETLAAGVVRSISVNANFPAVGEVSRAVRDFPHASIGIHFNLAVGRPVSSPSEVPSLVDREGRFLDKTFLRALLTGRIRRDEMRRELRAQVGVLRDLGVTPTHWDGHRNQHLLPGYFEVALEVAREAGIRRMRTNRHFLFTGSASRIPAIRHYLLHPDRFARHLVTAVWMARARRAGFRMADRMITPVRSGPGTWKTDQAFWVALFRWLPPGTSEIYCHPGYPDETLRTHARYVEEREAEARVLSDPALAEEAARHGVELMSFHEV